MYRGDIDMKPLHELVKQAQDARAANDHNLLKSTWSDIEDAINVHPSLLPSQRARLRNVLRERLDGLQAGSSDIDVNELEEYVKSHPEAGKKPFESGKARWLPY
jgi:hypothetical protein